MQQNHGGRLDQRDQGCWDEEAHQDLRRSGRQRWSVYIAPVPENHRAPTCWHLGGRGGNVRVARGSQSPDLPSAPVLRPVLYRASHWRSGPGSTPGSWAILRTVAPGVVSYRSTA